ncbi:MAG: hypothetical protein E7112_06790 [Bacteroidales bacterium]|nr:hypothetical protein [Bacteroidales bacterium]
MRKITRRFSLIALLFLLLCMTGCVNIKKLQEIRITDAKLEDVSAVTLRQYIVTGAVTVDNPAVEVYLSEISGVLEHSGKVIGSIAVDPIKLNARSEQTYHLRGDARLADGVGILELAKYMDKAVLKECVVDLKADVRVRNGKVRTIELDDIPLNKLLELIR